MRGEKLTPLLVQIFKTVITFFQVPNKPSDERKPSREKGPAPPPPPQAKEVPPSPGPLPQTEPASNIKDHTDSQGQLPQVSASPEEAATSAPSEVKIPKPPKVIRDVPTPVGVVAKPPTPITPVTPLTPTSQPKEADIPPTLPSGYAAAAAASAASNASTLPQVPADATSQNVDSHSTSGESKLTLSFVLLHCC